jgi:type II secretory pathway component PulM
MNKRFAFSLSQINYQTFRIFQKPTIENLDQAEEEFTLARLYLSKLKTEARSIIAVSSLFY